ncbi:MAG: DUF309 domain-containing protein [Campylobacterota bacterium]|nr:DUF309 domain-containing protein [Campylobacterota bacterium]
MKEINKFNQLINEKSYYDAHEVLEELWFPIRKTKDSYSLVLKGFINGAVSMELFKRDKVEQSKRVYQTYLKYTNKDRINNIENEQNFHELKIFMDNKFKVLYKK